MIANYAVFVRHPHYFLILAVGDDVVLIAFSVTSLNSIPDLVSFMIYSFSSILITGTLSLDGFIFISVLRIKVLTSFLNLNYVRHPGHPDRLPRCDNRQIPLY